LGVDRPRDAGAAAIRRGGLPAPLLEFLVSSRQREGARFHLLGQVGGVLTQRLGLLDVVLADLENLGGAFPGRNPLPRVGRGFCLAASASFSVRRGFCLAASAT
jgi:hypothetical protein